MKVVLLQDVKDIGKKDQVVTVSDGYARNFLLPRKLAKEATAAVMDEVKTKESAKAHHKQEEINAATEVKNKINDKIITLKAKAGKKLVLCIALASPTRYELSDKASEVTVLVDVDALKL